MHEGLIAVSSGHIARWKIESEEEMELAIKADDSSFGKKKYCEFYQKNDPKYFDKGVELAKAVINSHKFEWDGGGDLIEDMIYSLHRFGFTYREYFWFKLYNLSAYGRNNFISDKMRYEYYIELNSKKGLDLLRDKGQTYSRLKDFYKRDCLAVYTEKDKEKFNEFIKKHAEFFYKPLEMDSAKNCCKISSSSITFEKLFENGAFIIEELIIQNGDFADFYKDAVNLIRVPLLKTKDGEMHLMGPFLTFGKDGMHAVNAGAGGIIATIEPNSGVVIGNGWVEDSEIDYLYHPQSKKRIIGYEIPYWNDAVKICKEAAKLIPECNYIGFDLAQTERGWIIIEANGYAQFLGQRDTTGLKRLMLEYLSTY